jgi:hypothetical protein
MRESAFCAACTRQDQMKIKLKGKKAITEGVINAK